MKNFPIICWWGIHAFVLTVPSSSSALYPTLPTTHLESDTYSSFKTLLRFNSFKKSFLTTRMWELETPPLYHLCTVHVLLSGRPVPVSLAYTLVSPGSQCTPQWMELFPSLCSCAQGDAWHTKHHVEWMNGCMLEWANEWVKTFSSLFPTTRDVQ